MENLVVFKCLVKYLGTQDIRSLILVNKNMYNLFYTNRNYICLTLQRKLIYIKVTMLLNGQFKLKIKAWDKLPKDILNYYRYELNSSKLYIVFYFYGDFVKSVSFFDNKKLAQDFFCERVKENLCVEQNNCVEQNLEIIRRVNFWRYSYSFCEKTMGWILCNVRV